MINALDHTLDLSHAFLSSPVQMWVEVSVSKERIIGKTYQRQMKTLIKHTSTNLLRKSRHPSMADDTFPATHEQVGTY